MTICVKCKHYRLIGSVPSARGVPADAIWYNQFCGASPAPKQMNFVIGKEETATGNFYLYCRDVNTNGQCPKYEAKEEA